MPRRRPGATRAGQRGTLGEGRQLVICATGIHPEPNDAFRYTFLRGKELTAAEVERCQSRLSGWTGPVLLYISRLEEVEEAAHGPLARWLQWNRIMCLACCERTDSLSPKLLELFPWQWVTGSGTGFPEPVVRPAEGNDNLSVSSTSLLE